MTARECKAFSRSRSLAVIARLTAAEAFELLKAGNERFVSGRPEAHGYGPRVAEFADGQKPFAVVLGCSDSRVPIETIFDQVPGKIFVVRVAGNFLNDDNLGSIEFAISALKATLIVVLGHSHCGALQAALAYVRDGTAQGGFVQRIVDAVTPAVLAAQGAGGDWLERAISENVAFNAEAIIARSKIVSDAVASAQVGVIGGVYNVISGRVAFA